MAIFALALLDLAVTTLAAPGGCAIRGTTAELGLEIAPGDGIAPFYVKIEGAPYAIRPGEKSAARVPIDVDGLLRFRGTVGKIGLQLTRPVDAASGMVHLGGDARLTAPRSQGGDAIGAITIADEVILDDVALPCDALTADDAKLPRPERVRDAGDSLEVVAPKIIFHARPGAGERVAMRRGDRRTTVFLTALASDGKWTRGVYRSYGGSSVTGWVETRFLRPPSGFGLGGMGGSSHCCGGRGVVVATNMYRGPATVEKNTPVFADPGRGAWAVVTRDATLDVEWIRGRPWAKITKVPNVSQGCDELDRAWIAVERMKLPAD